MKHLYRMIPHVPGAGLLMMLAALAAAGCASTPTPGEPIASPNDDRAYRYLTLPNELRVLLISDSQAEKSAAAMTVFRGSYDDPDDYPGLAHFLEHMLFIGTDKYPEVDGYQQFLVHHGGASNAYTAADHTNFFFDVSSDAYPEALDRFAQFFVAPLLDPAYIDREKNAVDSEYQLQLKDDGWRGFAVGKVAYDPDHPGSRFTIGNLDTLGTGVGPALNRFFSSNYSADQMALVALGNVDLDTLETAVRERFSAIENRDLGDAPARGRLYAPGKDPHRARVLEHRSLKETYTLTYNFLVPPLHPHYREKPGDYIANLLGHEGQGTLHAYLKGRGWIESLAAGSTTVDADNGMISVQLELTADGVTHRPAITEALFAYIELIRRTGIERWRFDEQARVADLAFRFQEQATPMRTVYGLGPRLMWIPPRDVLREPYLLERYDPALIRRYLDELTPANLLVEYASPDVTGDRTEAYFDVPYSMTVADIEPPAANEALALPAPNPFLPDDLSLVDAQDPAPRAVDAPSGIALWLARDPSFKVPRANQYFRLAVPGGIQTAEDRVFAELYGALVLDSLNAWAYPAQLAGLSFFVGPDPVGFQVRVSGYDDKQPELLDRMLAAFATLDVASERFELEKTQLLQTWRNFEHERPYTQLEARSRREVQSPSWEPNALAETLAGKTPGDLDAWRDRKLTRFGVSGLLHGNLTQVDAAATAALFGRHLPIGAVEFAEPVTRVLGTREHHEIPVDHGDAGIAIYVQTAGEGYTARAKTALLVQAIRQAFFTELRTNQQLGYVVAARNRPIRNQPGLLFMIQSPVAPAEQLEGAIAQFLFDYADTIEELPQEAFEAFQQGLIVQLTAEDKNLTQRTERFWADLSLDDLTFNSQALISDQVARITKPELVRYYEDTLKRFQDRRLSVTTNGRFADPAIGYSGSTSR